MFVYKVHELWVLSVLYDAIEVKFTISFHCWNGLLLCPYRDILYAFMDLPVHGEQPVFVACSGRELWSIK